MAPRSLTHVVPLALTACLLALPATALAGGGRTSFDVGLQSDNVLLRGADPETAFDEAEDLGATPVRVTIHWADIAANCGDERTGDLRDPTNPCYQWQLVDEFVRRATARHIRIIASLAYAPRWVFGNTDSSYVGDTEQQFLTLAERYPAFVHAAAARYSPDSSIGTIDRWTIWNEPNSDTFWKPQGPDAAKRYAYLYSLAAPEIKSVDPLAQVAIGPTGPKSTTKPLVFVRRMQPWLESYFRPKGGAAKFVDAWAHNPYPGALLPPDFQVFAPPSVGIGNTGDLLDALDASPATRGVQVWATEYSYQTNPPDPDLGVSWKDQADWLADGAFLLWHTGRVSVLIWYVLDDPEPPTDWQSGLVTIEGRHKPSYRMFQRMVAVSKEVAGPGDDVELWGRASAEGDDPELVMARRGGGWQSVPNQIVNDDGSVSAHILPAMSVRVAMRSHDRIGPARVVTIGPWDDLLAEAGHLLGECPRCGRATR